MLCEASMPGLVAHTFLLLVGGVVDLRTTISVAEEVALPIDEPYRNISRTHKSNERDEDL